MLLNDPEIQSKSIIDFQFGKLLRHSRSEHGCDVLDGCCFVKGSPGTLMIGVNEFEAFLRHVQCYTCHVTYKYLLYVICIMLCLYLMYCDTCCEDLYLKYKLLSYMLLYMAYTPSQKARPRRSHFLANYCGLSPVIITHNLLYIMMT